MSHKFFKVVDHVIPCQHVREYPNVTRDEHPLQLAVKQYVPLQNAQSSENAITIIAAYGNGFPKECYEPLWEDLAKLSQSQNFSIRGIWAADCSQQGVSGVLNEHTQGDDTSWFDHSRDLLVMVNRFADQMPRPIVGVAHSMGCAQLVNLSIFHPRLFSALVLIEPAILNKHPPGKNAAFMSTFRKDLWPSRGAAENEFRKNKYFQAWDSRVLDRYLQYGLRQVPTAIYSYPSTDNSVQKDSVTLTTTKHQESWSYLRPNFEPQSESMDRLLSPDLDPKIEGQQSSHRAEGVITMRNLPHLRPNVLYLFGGKSYVSSETEQMEKLLHTGVGVGGSGGSKTGRVKRAVFGENSHLLPFEAPSKCASVIAEWLMAYLNEYKATEEFYKTYGSRKSDKGMLVASQEWKDLVKMSTSTLRQPREKL